MKQSLHSTRQVIAMRSRQAALAATFLLALGAAAPAGAATALGATWGSGCGSSTCFDSHGTYTLTFSASAFSGKVDIGSLLLDRRVLGSLGGSFFNVSFQLGGQQLGAWGNWNMGGVAGDELSLWGPGLTWDTSTGDLVLVLQLVAPNGEIIGLDQGGNGGGFFGDGGFSPVVTPPITDSFSGDGTDLLGPSGGLPGILPPSSGDSPPNGDGQTVPSSPSLSVAAVPEPSAWALMIGGLAMTGAALRRRKATPAARTA